MQEQSEVTDEQWVKARYPEAWHDDECVCVWSDRTLDYEWLGASWTEAATKLGGRLEPKPDAEAKPADERAAFARINRAAWPNNAQPKPDTADPMGFVAAIMEEPMDYDVGGILEGAVISRPKPDAAGEAKATGLDAYDAGLLNNYGGGNVDWWHEYIRSLLSDAHEHYESQHEDVLSAPRNSALEDAAKEMAEAASPFIQTTNDIYVSDKQRDALDAALARFRALGGE